jgi:hypothetical protein
MEFTSHFLLLRKAGLPPKIHPRAEHDWEREVASRQGERGDKEKEMSIGAQGKWWEEKYDGLIWEKLRYLMAEIKLFIRDPSNIWVKHVSIKTDAFQRDLRIRVLCSSIGVAVQKVKI